MRPGSEVMTNYKSTSFPLCCRLLTYVLGDKLGNSQDVHYGDEGVGDSGEDLQPQLEDSV